MRKHSLIKHYKSISLLLSISIISAAFGFISYTDVVQNKPASVSSFKNLTIVIDAGHGGEDGGAIGINGSLEKEINLNISKNLESLFSLIDIDVVMTRTGDYLLYNENQSERKKYYDVRNRVEAAENVTSPLFISIHQNKFPISKYKGLQVYYSANNSDSKIIADEIQNTTKNYLQNDNDRKTKQAGKNIYILKHLECPAVLIECGFLSNPEEESTLITNEYQKKLAFVFFSSVLEFLENKYLV